MSFDGLFVHLLTHELNENLLGGRISKIQQPYTNEIILRIRANRKNTSLLLSAHPQYARIQLTDIPFENPQSPPQFCMVLRKHLEGAIIESITQKENDRVLTFTFKNRNELGDTRTLSLVVEVMGRHSNILLIDDEENKLVDAIRHISPNQNSYRTLLPGAPYKEAPSQDKANPITFDGELNVPDMPEKELAKWFQQEFQGLGRDSADEISYLIQANPDRSPKETFDQFMKPFREKQAQPTLVQKDQKEVFTPILYHHIEGNPIRFDSLSSLMDRYYHNKAERDRVNQQSNDLSHLLKNLHQKNEKKLDKLNKELKETGRADEFRIKGEVLTAYLHEVKKGDEHITLPNFYEEDQELTIELNPQKSPSENAQYYFSRYQKLKNAKVHLTKQIQATKEETDYFDTLLTQLSIASVSDIEEIREELRQGHYLKKKKPSNKNKKVAKSKPESFTSSDGTRILVGKNNTQNDQLTMKQARKSYWWAHTKDIPGSHVIIESSEPTDQTVEEACILAAYYSKYRQSASVPVDVVQVKNIRKPNGAKPGYVIYEGQTTYYVTPSEEKVDALRTTN
ncbi:NFACT RNA binding domain-containing protein [Alkalibacterium sp. MB6]|uniref:NFACT RNA binding domain-containing protein n=1 Tax=Alkalibacterium sp. MB6 TaxID=2081965 RepID=UPI0013795CE8|nr:NFACT RNA binding domain-containing protein [Alkalibacterium sp. MB6]